MSMITALQPLPANKENDHLPHVLLVVDQFPKNLGGGERIVLKLAALLPQYGYRVSILTFFVHAECAALASPVCPVFVLPLKSTYNLTALRAAFDLRALIKQQKIQIVQTFFESSDIWAGFVTKALSKAKLIWSRRDMGILRTRKHHIAYRRMARMPDAVFAVSELVRKYTIDVDGIDPDRVLTVYNGLNLGDWDATSRTSVIGKKIAITTAGNIRHVKGHDVFIRAAALIAPDFPEVSFTIAGAVLDPDYFASLQSLVSELNLAGCFHFLGGIDDLRQHLSAADIFVLPSRSEGFSNAIVEAMAAGLPVIATNVGGNAEAVQDDVNGFIIPPEDPAALAAALRELLANPDRIAPMGAASKRLALNFTTETMMQRITETYARLLANQ
jgi:L-malate glycosyltransferase